MRSSQIAEVLSTEYASINVFENQIEISCVVE